MKVTLAKLSACPCGFPLLREDIPLGAEYEIEPDVRIINTLICGGCKTQYLLPCVFVHHENPKKAGWLPECVFSHLATPTPK